MSTAEKKLARKRLSALELAQRLRDVSEACRRRGMSRTEFLECAGRPLESGRACHTNNAT